MDISQEHLSYKHCRLFICLPDSQQLSHVQQA